MIRIIILFLLALAFSCNNLHDTNGNQEAKNEGPDIDIPFAQDYHEGYMVDEKASGANDVRAIQADGNDNIWIASKSGAFMKKQDSVLAP